jgi:hypothetical protein
MNFLDIFIDTLGTPEDISKLNEYLELLNEAHDTDTYCEKHHILPVAVFQEYEKVNDNLVTIPYKIHQKAHILLAEAYRIRPFVNAANLMNRYNISETLKKSYSQLQSEFMKNKHKNNPEMAVEFGLFISDLWKNYSDEKYSSICKNMSESKKKLFNSLTYEERSALGLYEKRKWQNMSEKEYIDACKKRSEQWTDEMKAAQSERLAKQWQDPEFREQQTKQIKNRYKDPKYKEKHRVASEKANKSLEKREDASIKIKAKWQDPEFREKMSKRKTRARQVQVTFADGTEEVGGMNALIKKYNFNATLIYKFINTHSPVNFDNAIKKGHAITEKTANTIGIIFNDYKETNETD